MVDNNWKDKKINEVYDIELSDDLKKILPNEYCLFHYKKNVFENLSWGKNGLTKIINNLNNYYSKIILINDIEGGPDNIFIKEKYECYDFKIKNTSIKKNDVVYLENIDGKDLFNVIRFSKKQLHAMVLSH